MATLRAPSLRRSRSRSTLLVALTLLGGLLPPVFLAVQPARADGLTLQVSRELTVTGSDTAVLTATLSAVPPAATKIDFEILPAPAGQPSADKDGDTPDTPDAQCTTDP